MNPGNVAPERTSLPMTETGCRSHFCKPEEIEAAGGPLAYVEDWLAHDGQGPGWEQAQLKARQLSLF